MPPNLIATFFFLKTKSTDRLDSDRDSIFQQIFEYEQHNTPTEQAGQAASKYCESAGIRGFP
jgi:hypothetical protein